MPNWKNYAIHNHNFKQLNKLYDRVKTLITKITITLNPWSLRHSCRFSWTTLKTKGRN